MSKKIGYKDADGRTGIVEIWEEPDLCPLCHRHITPIFVHAYSCRDGENLRIIYRCPNRECDELFISYYYSHGNYFDYRFSAPWSTEKREFSEIIKKISGNFCAIYNQAYEGEKRKLLEICGAGYRKALEFLIKDYAIQKNKKDKAKIRKIWLSDCIKTYIDDKRIKSCAERAVWLGNDETHYYRQWKSKDLADLKDLIELTVNWIELVERSDKYIKEMKRPSKKSKTSPSRRQKSCRFRLTSRP